MNLIPEIAKMLGVEIGEEFKISIFKLSLWKFDSDKGLLVKHNEMQDWMEACAEQYMKLLNGFYQIEKLPFKPKEGEWYCMFMFCGDDFCVASTEFSNYDVQDLTNAYCGNCFRTKEEANNHKAEIYEKLTGKKWEE